jgi:hypothetical protein
VDALGRQELRCLARSRRRHDEPAELRVEPGPAELAEVGGNVAERPAAMVPSDNRIEPFVRAADGSLHHGTRH